jgi:hypothetical protein
MKNVIISLIGLALISCAAVAGAPRKTLRVPPDSTPQEVCEGVGGTVYRVSRDGKEVICTLDE